MAPCVTLEQQTRTTCEHCKSRRQKKNWDILEQKCSLFTLEYISFSSSPESKGTSTIVMNFSGLDLGAVSLDDDQKSEIILREDQEAQGSPDITGPPSDLESVDVKASDKGRGVDF